MSINDEYSVGSLLYMPGLRTDIAEKLGNGSLTGRASAAVCLEDTVKDSMTEQAELNTAEQLGRLKGQEELPNIYIRVRSAAQIDKMMSLPGECAEVIKGFIIPKADDEVITDYIPVIKGFEKRYGRQMSFMPIIENPSLLKLDTRYKKLTGLYEKLMEVRQHILNIRVGGNDFSRAMGLSCGIGNTVYDIAPVAHMLSDIAVTFTPDFTVSAPVWNYFDSGSGDTRWKEGLRREMAVDRMYGFIGKTVIHPSQIDVVREEMSVSAAELEDAKRLLSSEENGIQVIKSADGGRMMEHKVHRGWAEKIIAMAEIYGVKKDEDNI